ncbi:MAG TPA: MmcQ/YjbR family DNA-binding protein [Thermoanaerobaculia bacterium]
MPRIADTALARVRKICLSLPDTEEKIAWGEPTFRVGGRLFVMFANDHHGDGRIALWCNAPEDAQRDIVASDEEHFFVPPYVGPSGWVGMRLDRKLSEKAMAAVIVQAYETTKAKLKTKTKRKRLATS